jgi:hypothetical protein
MLLLSAGEEQFRLLESFVANVPEDGTHLVGDVGEPSVVEDEASLDPRWATAAMPRQEDLALRAGHPSHLG